MKNTVEKIENEISKIECLMKLGKRSSRYQKDLNIARGTLVWVLDPDAYTQPSDAIFENVKGG